MLHIFNRTLLLSTKIVDEMMNVKDVLSENQIAYSIKQSMRTQRNPIKTNIQIPIDLMPEEAKEYLIYVHKNDLQQASHLMNQYLKKSKQ